MQRRSFQGFYTHGRKSFSQLLNVHPLSGDHELADASDIDWLLSLFLELERHLVFLHAADLFGRQFAGNFFQGGHVNRFWVSEQSHDKTAADEGDSLSSCFQLFGVRWEPGNVECWIWTLRFDVECLLLSVLEE